MEIWKDIIGYEGLYQVSNFGNVKSLERKDINGHLRKEKYLKQQKNNNGYLRVCLFKSKRKWFFTHILVAKAFTEICGKYFENAQINHKDENKLNNCADNLEWCTQQYNNKYGSRIKRLKQTKTNGKKSKIVAQFDTNNNFIKEYPSVNEIKRQLGFHTGYICDCCNGKFKTAYGYIWKYKKAV